MGVSLEGWANAEMGVEAKDRRRLGCRDVVATALTALLSMMYVCITG